jgi:hypothetical protein
MLRFCSRGVTSSYWLVSLWPTPERQLREGVDAFKKLRALLILVKTYGLQEFELSLHALLHEVLMLCAN